MMNGSYRSTTVGIGRAVREEIVRGVSLHDRDVGFARVALQRLRRDRVDAAAVNGAGVAREQRHLVAVGEQHLRHLQETDADAGRLAVAERLGADEQRTRHPRPFTRLDDRVQLPRARLEDRVEQVLQPRDLGVQRAVRALQLRRSAGSTSRQPRRRRA